MKGMPQPLGRGSIRTVYAYDENKVLKVQKFCNKSNEVEYSLWQEVKDTDDAKYFYAVYDTAPSACSSDSYYCSSNPCIISHGWLIMERAHLLVDDYLKREYPDVDDWWDRDQLMRNHPKYKEMRDVVCTYDVGDLHTQNIGIREDGTWAVLDYGY